MDKKMFKKGRLVAIIVIALVLSVTTYAFAAANTVDKSSAGEGSAAISGFTITNVAYTLDTDPTNIAKVGFTATSAGSPVGTPKFMVKLSGITWVSCDAVTGSSPYTVTCTGALGTVNAATLLDIIAYQ